MKNKKLLAFIIIASVFVIPTFILIGTNLYSTFLEINSPIIESFQFARGIGSTPVKFEFNITDNQSGLDQVTVRVLQEKQIFTLVDQKLEGNKASNITIELPSSKASLNDGTAKLVVKAFDQSLWSNRGEKVFEIVVDTTPPQVKVTSASSSNPTNSELIFYEAIDDNLVLHGAKLNNDIFFGISVRKLTKETSAYSQYALLLPLTNVKTPKQKIKIFAEDQVGNASSVDWPSNARTIKPNRFVTILDQETISSRLMFAVESLSKFLNIAVNNNLTTSLSNLYQLDRNKILAELKSNYSFDKIFDDYFLLPPGDIKFKFGDNLELRNLQNHKIADFESTGVGISLAVNFILAANSGIVRIVEKSELFGDLLAIDHGLGLVSIYRNIDNLTVKLGDKVTKGQKLGLPGNTGLVYGELFYFEVNLNGIPVDPLEWTDKSWYYTQIEEKIKNIIK